MKLPQTFQPRGIALIIVMIVIVILATLAGGFAYSMKVEMSLARNSRFQADLDMLGRSGVEYARWILAMHLRDPREAAYTALNQKWAGGPATTNELLMDVPLEDVELGPGKFSIEMTDLERKFNLSMIREGNSDVLQRALELIGVDVAQAGIIVDSYLDWVDPDDGRRVQGAESEDYLRMIPGKPYTAKNGLMDDVSEFLMVQGVTESVYWGSGRTGIPNSEGEERGPRGSSAFLSGSTEGPLAVGLVDLFTTISGAGMGVNVNTASREVLQLLPGVDAGLADAIVETRAGPDHVDGTWDDIPFEQAIDLAAVPGMDPGLTQMIGRFLSLRSFLFEVRVTAEIGGFQRKYVALLHRRNQQDVAILYFHPL